MLSDLQELQSSDESLWHIDLSFDIETRSEDGNELVHKTYTFSYAKGWDKWTFKEYHEERTDDTTRMSDRNWKRARHIIWQDINETRTVNVPPEVADALAEATGSESVTIQVPVGGIDKNEYKEIHSAEKREA